MPIWLMWMSWPCQSASSNLLPPHHVADLRTPIYFRCDEPDYIGFVAGSVVKQPCQGAYRQNNILTVGLTRDFQTVGYVHVESDIFVRADAH
jgi:hypothetical protein